MSDKLHQLRQQSWQPQPSQSPQQSQQPQPTTRPASPATATAAPLFHTLPPVYNATSRALILGSFPSPKSREIGFYYGHPQNRFWRVLAALFTCPAPQTNAQRKALLLTHHIALWDVLASCRITGAADGSIRDPQPNDIGRILRAAPIAAVYTTGGKAHELYQKLVYPQTHVPAVRLPSTSPANARLSLEQLVAQYRVILDVVQP